MTDALEIDIALTRGAFTLDIAFAAPLDRVTGVVGPSGAGKSTLFACLAGLTRPDRGRIVLGERVLFDAARRINLPTRRRGLGVVFQDGLLFPHLSVRRNLTYGMRRADPALFDRTVGVLGLGPLLSRRPPGLSGGERQRVAIGRALLAAPRLLLLDEPLAAVDAARKAEILDLLAAIGTETGVPMLYVSHAPEEISRLADEVVTMRDGRLAWAAVVPRPARTAPIGAAQWA